MGYKTMRLRKYYDAFRTNKSILKTSFAQKKKILLNILKFFISGKKLIVNHKPVTAQIEPTSECNLKCVMCIREKMGVPIGTMSFGNFRTVLDKLDSLFKIHLSGQGEPFLNPEIFKMINYANKKGVLVKLSTNGSLITKSIAKKICGVDIGEITVSIDSTKKSKYEKIRKGAKFARLVENIKNLSKELKKARKQTILSSATVILKENIDELEDFVEFAKKVGITKIIFQTIQEKDDYLEKYDEKIRKQRVSNFADKVKTKIQKIKELGNKYGIIVIFDEQKSKGCIWPWRSIYITWNGYVTPCCKILDYRKLKSGNLLKENFWDVWNGQQYQMFRKLLRERKAPSLCKGCNMI